MSASYSSDDFKANTYPAYASPDATKNDYNDYDEAKRNGKVSENAHIANLKQDEPHAVASNERNSVSESTSAESAMSDGNARYSFGTPSQLCVPFNTPTKPARSHRSSSLMPLSSSPILMPSTPSLDDSLDASLLSIDPELESVSFIDDDLPTYLPTSPLGIGLGIGLGIHGLLKKNGDPFDGLGILSLHAPVCVGPRFSSPTRVSNPMATIFEHDHPEDDDNFDEISKGLSNMMLEQVYDSFVTDPYHLRALSPIFEVTDELASSSSVTGIANDDREDVFTCSSFNGSTSTGTSSLRPKVVHTLPRSTRSLRRLTRDLSTPTISSQLKSTQRRRRSASDSQGASWRF